MGRQPFGLASPTAWLREAGAHVECLDLSVEPFSEQAVLAADLIAFYIPMHTATRVAAAAMDRVRRLNREAHVCFYGLYAPENASYLRSLGVDSVLGGEFEAGLVELAQRVAASTERRVRREGPSVSLDRQTFLVPDRSSLPDLRHYAHLVCETGEHVIAGYTEASRGCKHHCRHCPIVPVYHGRFRIVQRDVVLEDISQQVAAGARHITFGDPDFFNGPGHALPLVAALHDEHPELTYDVTIKVEHLRRHLQDLPLLRNTGCVFVTSAVESFDEHVLTIFDKQHSREDFEEVLAACREIGLPLVPTFVAFTPWTSLNDYRLFLAEIVRLDLIDHVSPVQYTIRLLIPPGSVLLELPDVQELVGNLAAECLYYPWRHPDPRMDELQRDLENLVRVSERCARREIFSQIWERAFQGSSAPTSRLKPSDHPRFIPYLTEPWYC
jgi:radical SAM superfamily enzyme YgiQ (UPF0313 family)